MPVDANALQTVAELLAQRKPDSPDSSPVPSVKLRPYLSTVAFAKAISALAEKPIFQGHSTVGLENTSNYGSKLRFAIFL